MKAITAGENLSVVDFYWNIRFYVEKIEYLICLFLILIAVGSKHF